MGGGETLLLMCLWQLEREDGAEGLCNGLSLSPFLATLSPAPMTSLNNSCLPDILLPSSMHFPILFLSPFSSSSFFPIELTHVYTDGVKSWES